MASTSSVTYNPTASSNVCTTGNGEDSEKSPTSFGSGSMNTKAGQPSVGAGESGPDGDGNTVGENTLETSSNAETNEQKAPTSAENQGDEVESKEGEVSDGEFARQRRIAIKADELQTGGHHPC